MTSSRVEMRDEVTEPDPEHVKTYEAYYEVYSSLYPAQRDAMHRLSTLAAGRME